jgi:FMN phosphatase YigB (HAD superfamily)
MKESLPKAILFDLDDTLADRAAAIRHCAGVFYGSHPQLHSAYGRREVVDAYVRPRSSGTASRSRRSS